MPRSPHSHDGAPSTASPLSAAAVEKLCILVAEDEFLLAIQLEEELRDAGHDVIGPYTSVAKVMQAVQDETFDIAVLDVNLNGELIYPLADDLQARGIPFVLLSGYGAANLPERFRESPRVVKPHDSTMLFREIRRALRRES
jgi:two-component system, response regulator PdtaR